MAVVERVDAAPGERRRLRLANPATLAPLGELEIDTAEHVRAAVERARKAQVEWAALGFRARAHYLDRAARHLATRADEFAERIAAETGKPRAELLTTEILTGNFFEQVARTLGAAPSRVFATITLPLAARGLIAGAVLAFARGLGEFGATIMIAGYIPGKTATLALSIYHSVQLGHDAEALTFLTISVVIAFAAVLLSEWLLRRRVS